MKKIIFLFMILLTTIVSNVIGQETNQPIVSQSSKDSTLIDRVHLNQLVYVANYGRGYIAYIEKGTKFIEPYIKVIFNDDSIIFFDKNGRYYEGKDIYEIIVEVLN